ncbi:anthranilate phosphoribosyltransferase [Anaerobacillus sp. MEB173]|uniref:anthranilate phosphoribosyltransferase n=1 Tax=Anaerobacillus sp. MEB173 TaxID=3383345 RepID=UPI003F930D22
MLKSVLKKCVEGATLSENEAKQVMDEIMSGETTPSQISSLLSILRFRGETVDEMVGFARSMQEHVITIPHNETNIIDTCGTGGDGSGTFNVSTTTAIVLSANGVKVAKHGNRAVSSKSGSADVLEQLEIDIQGSPKEAVTALKEKGMCFLFAPLYHVAMKHAVTPRREIGFRTIFNLLGPLTNPARAKHQLIGVFDTKFAEKMAHTLNRLGTKRALFVTGGEGIDECSITTHTDVVELNDGIVNRYVITPEQFGLPRGNMADIQVKNSSESAKLIHSILRGESNESARNIIILNAACGLYVSERVESIQEGIDQVKHSLESGQVLQQFQKLQKTGENQSYA